MSNLRFSKGKSFIAPPRVFKAEHALYFPNLQGVTLLPNTQALDTTPVLNNSISIVSVFNTQWAENQCRTFVSKESNPHLHIGVTVSSGAAQFVEISHEDNWLKYWIVRGMMSSLRRQRKEEDWGKFFLVRKGFDESIREQIGILNNKVGYTYLVDGNCKIRWAGSGEAAEGEKQSLVKSMDWLLEERARRLLRNSSEAQAIASAA